MAALNEGCMKEFRVDFSESLVHLTRERAGPPLQDGKLDDDSEYSALDVLCEILRDGKLRGSANSGFIKGNTPAVCFSECPLSAIKLFAKKSDEENARYRFYGIAVSKKSAFSQGARPVIYLPDDEGEWIPSSEKWRHVRFEYGKVDWTFEREWRSKGDFELGNTLGFYIVHWHTNERTRIESALRKDLREKIRGYLPMLHLNQMF